MGTQTRSSRRHSLPLKRRLLSLKRPRRRKQEEHQQGSNRKTRTIAFSDSKTTRFKSEEINKETTTKRETKPVESQSKLKTEVHLDAAEEKLKSCEILSNRMPIKKPTLTTDSASF